MNCPKPRLSRERGSRGAHQGRTADDHDDDADPQVCLLILHEPRRDPLVDDVALLEEQLPRRDRGADDPDDQQHDGGQLPGAAGQLRDDEVMRQSGVTCGWAMKYTGISSRLPAQNATAIRSNRRKLPVNAEPTTTAAASATAAIFGSAEVPGRQGDPDELGDDGQRVQDEQVDDAERAPELAEPLQDQPGMPDAGHRAQPEHHFLVHVQHRNKQQERPQQLRAVVLAGLAVGREGACVVVSDHHDQAGADDGQ